MFFLAYALPRGGHADRVSLSDAISFLMSEPSGAGAGAGASSGRDAGWSETNAGDIQSLSFGGRKPPQGAAGGPGDDGARSGDDLFSDLLSTDVTPPGEMVRVPAAVLKALRPSDVFIVRSGSRRNMQVRCF